MLELRHLFPRTNMQVAKCHTFRDFTFGPLSLDSHIYVSWAGYPFLIVKASKFKRINNCIYLIGCIKKTKPLQVFWE